MTTSWISASWVPSDESLGLTIERVPYGPGNGPNPEGGVRYAVRRNGRLVLDKETNDFEFEPMPSMRDEEFYARCRFDTLEEAQAAADVWIARRA